ncbi:uncharacterized protein UV8b_06389 [Ustilaginoidea virens]|uniref:SRP9 domain-containing protein n=1 Tax=Ustilaginoidea virens TaxID=1159556 RepID=A0A063C9L2_USTVR|nr:uncharacterized protein UV8b_06389 [Ustilaginoidea virens]QUC22148.1 hypothetical protein UV8b_06389 [Ustilaginoidea virens]GAO16436.1 hypothetical protein UVI_02047970 [Ustilaginoidea virens]
MPHFKSSQEWLEKSTLLLEASPSTTRITTRYSIEQVKSRKARAGSTSDVEAPKPPRGSLVFTTYDTATGVTLKYRTTKAAEVTWLMQSSLGQLGRNMAAMPPVDRLDSKMPDAPAGAAEDGDGGNHAGGAATPALQAQPSQHPAGKKKKKGRK